jgi:hypothetical protein
VESGISGQSGIPGIIIKKSYWCLHRSGVRTGGFIVSSLSRNTMKSPSFVLPGVILMLLAVAAIFSGCISQTPTIEYQSPAPVVAASTNNATTVSSSYQDAELLSIGLEAGRALSPVISKISDDASGNDIISLGADSARLSSIAGNYYFQMRDLNVSPKYQAWKTNYLLGLLDVETAGDYFSKSAKYAQSGDYTNASTYLEQGNTLFQRSNHYLRLATASVRE